MARALLLRGRQLRPRAAVDPATAARLLRAEAVAAGSSRAAGPLPVLHLFGELDALTALTLGDRLRAHADGVPGSVVLVDLSGVSFIDFSGLDCLIQAHEDLAANDRLLVLQALPPGVRRLFQVVRGLGSCPLLEQALGARPEVAEVEDGGRPDQAAMGDADLDELRELVRQLRRDIHTGTVLDRARGLLMGVHGCDADEAGALLAQVCDRHHVAVADVAAALVAGAPTAAEELMVVDSEVSVTARAVRGDRRRPPVRPAARDAAGR